MFYPSSKLDAVKKLEKPLVASMFWLSKVRGSVLVDLSFLRLASAGMNHLT
jgi:hypothetical protein